MQDSTKTQEENIEEPKTQEIKYIIAQMPTVVLENGVEARFPEKMSYSQAIASLDVIKKILSERHQAESEISE